MKKAVSWFLALTMCLGMLTGCGTAATSSSTGSTDSIQQTEAGTDDTAGESDKSAASKTGGLHDRVVVAINADPGDMLPAKPMGNGKTKYLKSVFESLFDYDENNELVPSLAKGYTEVSDTDWDVEIYQTICDSEGNHITADDIVYAVNWLVESGNNIKYDVFDSIEKKDDYTVTYHWKHKPSAAELEFIFVRTFMFSQKAFEEHNFATDPVATGPFKITSFTSGSEITLEVNENYWAENTEEDVSARLQPLHSAAVQTVEFQIIAEASQAIVALEMGTVDLCDYVTFSSLSEFEEGGQYADQYKVDTNMSGDYYYMMPNMASNVMKDDLNLRLAMYYALDNGAISSSMGGDYAPLKSLGTDYFTDFNKEWEDEPTYINTYDLDKAKEYLAQSNYSGEKIVMVGLSNEECKNAMTMMQSLLAQVGINVEIQSYEESMLNPIIAEQTGWDFVVTRLGGSTLVASWNTLFNNNVHSGMTTNWYADDKLQQLYETALADETHDDEHVKECLDYALSLGLVYPFSGMASSIVYSRDIEELYYHEGYATVGCSTYVGQ